MISGTAIWPTACAWRVRRNRIVSDPVGAVSIVEAISTPGNRARGYQRLAAALPATERDRKRTLLERATRRAHAGVEGANDVLGRV